MQDDQQLAPVLDQLSEESLFQIVTLLNKRVRRAALDAQGGDKRTDLGALRQLQSAAQVAHDKKLGAL